jgi:hypothetical protein
MMPTAGDAPAKVEDARRAVSRLREKIPAQRQALADAQAGVTTAEANDRTRLAGELRAGRQAKADPRGVEEAQRRVELVRRESQALELAIADSEAALSEVVHAQTGRWLGDARRQEKAATVRAGELIAELRSTLEERARARGTIFWLETGLDRGRRAPAVILGELPESASHTGNRAPLQTAAVLGWISASLQPKPEPAPESAPPEPVRAA